MFEGLLSCGFLKSDSSFKTLSYVISHFLSLHSQYNPVIRRQLNVVYVVCYRHFSVFCNPWGVTSFYVLIHDKRVHSSLYTVDEMFIRCTVQVYSIRFSLSILMISCIRFHAVLNSRFSCQKCCSCSVILLQF